MAERPEWNGSPNCLIDRPGPSGSLAGNQFNKETRRKSADLRISSLLPMRLKRSVALMGTATLAGILKITAEPFLGDFPYIAGTSAQYLDTGAVQDL